MFRNGFAWLKALPLLLVTAALAILALLTLAGAQSPDARAREQLFDFYQRLAPASYDPAADFHTVLIDRESVDAVGPWPWPRTILADLVEKAGAAGARGVVITEPVDAPDPLSPETIGAFWLEGASDQALAAQLERLPSTDVVLAQAFAGIDGAVGVAATPLGDPFRVAALQRTDLSGSPWISIDGAADARLALPAARYFYGLDPDLALKASPAIAALAPDPDGLVRRAPLLWSLDNAPAPSIGLRAAMLASDGGTIEISVDSTSVKTQGRIAREIRFDGAALSVSDNTALRLYFPRRIEMPTTSATQLLTGRNTNSQLAGKTVLIGLDAEIGDSVATARGEMPRSALHALVAAQISAGEDPRRPVWTGYLEALGVMLLGAAAIMFAQRLQFWQAIGAAAALSAVLVAIAFGVFASASLLVDPLAPSLALFVGALSVAGGRSIGGVLRDDSLRGSFHDTLPEPVMKRLREDGAVDILAGAYRDVTVLACELRLDDDDLHMLEGQPDDVTKILAAASIDVRQTIIDAGGAADQAEGGRLFAYFNAPGELADHIQAGCAAALRLIESMDKINTDLESSSRTRGIQVHLAIGIATGRCFVGPMGHGRNNRYSAVGPAVDRASFLRRQSEYYGPAMICDETVYKETHHQFAFLELDRVKVRHGDKPFSLYALIGNPFIKSSKGFRELDDAHREMLIAFRQGDLAKAEAMLATVRKSPGAKIALFDIYADRLKAMAEAGAPDGWDGVTRLDG